jgi:hypothetical protein
MTRKKKESYGDILFFSILQLKDYLFSARKQNYFLYEKMTMNIIR